MTEINRLENELKNFHKGSDYSVSVDKDRDEKIYTSRSESLKQSLHNIVHSRASEEWQISHAFGQDGIEYAMERDNKFGLYRKSLDNSPDEFSILDTGRLRDNSSPLSRRREKFLQSVRGIERSRQIIEESRRRNELRQQGSGFGTDNFVSYSSSRNEKGERVIRKEEHYSDPAQEQATREGYGYTLANEIFSELSKEKGNVFSLPETDRARIENQSGYSDEEKPKSFSTSQQNEKNLHELEEELTYLKNLPDEKGYLKKNIQKLESKIFSIKQRQNFVYSHQIPPKK
jgi:hypothetical protein